MARVEAGALVGAKYQILRTVGTGGMGTVWSARHIHLDMRVAIKFVHPGEDDATVGGVRARFEREARVSARIRSPHVVEVKDYGVEGRVPYLVMELLEGEDLGKHIRREGRLSLEAVDVIVYGACKALSAAHAAGVIHRDLKPGNVFMARMGPDTIIKVLDFGVAKGIDATDADEMTRTGMLVGTPLYMSPEQVRDGKRVDGRSDLWSLAVIAFRLLTGRPPFLGESMEVLAAILRDAAPAPSSLVPELGPDVDAFFVRALAKNRKERFQTAQELSHAFAALCTEARRSLSDADAVEARRSWSDAAAAETAAKAEMAETIRLRPLGRALQARAIDSEVGTTQPVRRAQEATEERPTRTEMGSSMPVHRQAEKPFRRILNRWLVVAALLTATVVCLRLWHDDVSVARSPFAGATAVSARPGDAQLAPVPTVSPAPSEPLLAPEVEPAPTPVEDAPTPVPRSPSTAAPRPAPEAKANSSVAPPGNVRDLGSKVPDNQPQPVASPPAASGAAVSLPLSPPATSQPGPSSPPQPPPPSAKANASAPPLILGF